MWTILSEMMIKLFLTNNHKATRNLGGKWQKPMSAVELIVLYLNEYSGSFSGL